MNFKMMLAAAAIAIAPGIASALTVMNDGDSFNVGTGGDGGFFSGVAFGNGGAGDFSVEFTSLDDPLGAAASGSITGVELGTFTDLMLSWIGAGDVVLASAAFVDGVQPALQTVFTAPDLVQTFKVSWTGSQEGVGFDVNVSTVPLPAGVLLMGTALAGFGVASRRKKKAAAA